MGCVFRRTKAERFAPMTPISFTGDRGFRRGTRIKNEQGLKERDDSKDEHALECDRGSLQGRLGEEFFL
jgi:hypothetical protein